MPFNSFTLNCDVTRQAEDILVVEGGWLEAVVLMCEAHQTDYAEFYGQILLASTDTPTHVPIALLAADYFGGSFGVAWTGRIKMEPSFAVVARIYSPNTDPVRCTILTTKEN